ncbi:MAG TPA: hypothetical protein VKE93_04775 [Candidatus Angelobacter sp.]|nr:hypothetical protein [Candidatus Angelobacter sp.]
MRYFRAILLGVSLIAGMSALASAQSVVAVQWRQDDDRWRYDGDHDRDDRGGYYGASTARHVGYQDGFNDGLNDRRTGHSYRPTHDSSYHHADRGYERSFGSRGYYKQAYRDAYLQGYSRGYNSNPWYRR